MESGKLSYSAAIYTSKGKAIGKRSDLAFVNATNLFEYSG